jgi:hypothetical protein
MWWDSKACCGFRGRDPPDLFVDIDFDFCDLCIVLKENGKLQELAKDRTFVPRNQLLP